MEEKLWTKKYIFSLLVLLGISMGYSLLNSVMPIYGNLLTSSNIIGGYMITVFTISALFIRLFIKKINEVLSNKVLLIMGISLVIFSALGYCLFDNITIILFFRCLHGLGFGISLTCATAICNECVPSSRLSEGVGFTSSANTISNAIGPLMATSILGATYTNFLFLFEVLLIISVFVLLLSFFIKSSTKTNYKNIKNKSYKGLIIGGIFFLAAFAQGAINSFLISYGKQLDFDNIGLFFTLTALITFISRFYSKKIQDIFGIKKMCFILSLIMSMSILMISFIQEEILLFLLSVPYGGSMGLLFPLFNYRIIQTVDKTQFAYASSIYYSVLDIGYGLSAIVWGVVSQYFGFQTIYLLAAGLLVVMAILDRITYK